MGAYVTLALEALAFAAFVVFAALVPYVRRKRNYWTGRGVPVAASESTLAALPGFRLDDRALARHRTEAVATSIPVVGVHDAGKPCALVCDVRVAMAALGNDGFAERDQRLSLVPSVVDAAGVIAVLPAMTECVGELITSLEGAANRQLTVSPWSEVKKCSSTVVATCVYGQPMVDSRIKAFAEQCDKALSGRRGPADRPNATEYFTAYDLSANNELKAVNFKQMLRVAAAEDDRITAGKS